jgi:hypothetical protein
VVALPVAVEQAVERASFEDSVGTLPVEMSLCREGRSTLETGVLGDIHWQQSGPGGFGVRARVTGPPVAGGTLASYVDPRFIRANVEFIDRPNEAVRAYAAEFRDQIVRRTLLGTGAAAPVGGLIVLLVVEDVTVKGGLRRRRVTVAAVIIASLAASIGAASWLFSRWPCNGDPAPAYALPDVPRLTFSSPQTRELAMQVRPFIEKNTRRIEQRAEDYQAAAERSFARELAARGDDLVPRDGEVLVSAEADPQGARVGTDVRRSLYGLLATRLGEDGIALRTISGDITSNGTVAEDEFVAQEAAVAGDVPTVAVAGDHDSEATWAQMADHGMVVPDLATREVAGVQVSGANDVEHKALFGQVIRNDSSISEAELGAQLREVVDADEAGYVLLHQPEAVAGYLGLVGAVDLDDALDAAVSRAGVASRTRPYDDGIPDLPPGTVNIGHLHDLDGPWVLWNTDGPTVTWTVVDQLGTTGGVEENSTFNRFSTPISVPLKPVAWRLQYVDRATGLQTGFVTISCAEDGGCTISPRTDVGLPLGD